ncbi:GntR family transcriptional regulator [Microbacterium resistens]|uniref:GntR family transcriptional regulator n=1 Tax=Microbacterium resistens TaxID=156977 RepID=UPI0022F0E8A0|nr:GntR family transcriptional regulator [Streptomyces sp. MS2A]
MTIAASSHPLAALATPVNRASPMPAWAQVHRDLKGLIDQAADIGEQLPTELDLAAIYGISRITIRQALAALAQDGYVERRHGTGTFVADRPPLIQHDFGLLIPWRDRFRAAGEDAQSIHLVGGADEKEPFELAKELEPAERDQPRLHLKRLHKVNGRPIGLTDSWLAGRAARLLEGVELIEGSLSKTLEPLGVSSTETHHFLEVRTVTRAEASLLQTSEDGTLFVDWSIGRADGELIETSRTVWLGSRVRFHYAVSA